MSNKPLFSLVVVGRNEAHTIPRLLGSLAETGNKARAKRWKDSPKGKEWKQKYKESGKQRESDKRYREKNKDKIIEKSRKYHKENREREAKYRKEYNAKNKDVIRERSLIKKYGLSCSDIEKILQTQGGGCAICGTTNFNGVGIHIDHNHETGETRGILCGNCNLALGLVHDDKKKLENMINYLDTWGTK